MQRLAPAQVWSNPQAVEDYQALLSGVVPVVTDDMASVIVLGTSPEERRLGLFLNKINTRGDDQVLEVGALASLAATLPSKDGSGESQLESFPIYMCVGADELEAAIDAVPDAQRGDLVFVTDGFIEQVVCFPP